MMTRMTRTTVVLVCWCLLVTQSVVWAGPDKVLRIDCKSLEKPGGSVNCGRCEVIRSEAYLEDDVYKRSDNFCDKCSMRFASDKSVDVPSKKPEDPEPYMDMSKLCQVIPPVTSPWFWVFSVLFAGLLILLVWLILRRLKASAKQGSGEDYTPALEPEGSHQNISQVAQN